MSKIKNKKEIIDLIHLIDREGCVQDFFELFAYYFHPGNYELVDTTKQFDVADSKHIELLLEKIKNYCITKNINYLYERNRQR